MLASTQQYESHNSFSNIENLKASLTQNKQTQTMYRIRLETLNNTRTQIAQQIQKLSEQYEKKVKKLQEKLKKVQNENKQLRKKSSIYQSEIQSFQIRLIEKQKMISKLLQRKLDSNFYELTNNNNNSGLNKSSDSLYLSNMKKKNNQQNNVLNAFIVDQTKNEVSNDNVNGGQSLNKNKQSLKKTKRAVRGNDKMSGTQQNVAKPQVKENNIEDEGSNQIREQQGSHQFNPDAIFSQENKQLTKQLQNQQSSQSQQIAHLPERQPFKKPPPPPSKKRGAFNKKVNINKNDNFHLSNKNQNINAKDELHNLQSGQHQANPQSDKNYQNQQPIANSDKNQQNHNYPQQHQIQLEQQAVNMPPAQMITKNSIINDPFALTTEQSKTQKSQQIEDTYKQNKANSNIKEQQNSYEQERQQLDQQMKQISEINKKISQEYYLIDDDNQYKDEQKEKETINNDNSSDVVLKKVTPPPPPPMKGKKGGKRIGPPSRNIPKFSVNHQQSSSHDQAQEIDKNHSKNSNNTPIQVQNSQEQKEQHINNNITQTQTILHDIQTNDYHDRQQTVVKQKSFKQNIQQKQKPFNSTNNQRQEKVDENQIHKQNHNYDDNQNDSQNIIENDMHNVSRASHKKKRGKRPSPSQPSQSNCQFNKQKKSFQTEQTEQIIERETVKQTQTVNNIDLTEQVKSPQNFFANLGQEYEHQHQQQDEQLELQTVRQSHKSQPPINQEQGQKRRTPPPPPSSHTHNNNPISKSSIKKKMSPIARNSHQNNFSSQQPKADDFFSNFSQNNEKVSNDEQYDQRGFIDESSIEHIQDQSIISNTMFGDDFNDNSNNYLQQNYQSSVRQENVPAPPTKKMSKKKGKRDTNIKTIDPDTFE